MATRIRALIRAAGATASTAVLLAACSAGSGTPSPLPTLGRLGLPTLLPVSGPGQATARAPSLGQPGGSATPSASSSFGLPAAPSGPPSVGFPAPTGAAPPASLSGDIPAGSGPLANLDGGRSGPPGWVQAGTRLTWYSAAASVNAGGYRLDECTGAANSNDPNGCNWTDPTTGKHYRRNDDPAQAGTASGDGVAQLDVVALDGNRVALSLSLYTLDHNRNIWIPGYSTGLDVAGGAIDGAWANPGLLATIADTSLPGFLVLRGPLVLAGTTFQTISFVTSGTAYASSTYDLGSGVLLSSTSNTPSKPGTVSLPGQPPPQGNTEITLTRWLGGRQRTAPGIGGTSPGWVATAPGLKYAGTVAWTNPVDPSGGRSAIPCRLR